MSRGVRNLWDVTVEDEDGLKETVGYAYSREDAKLFAVAKKMSLALMDMLDAFGDFDGCPQDRQAIESAKDIFREIDPESQYAC